MARFAKDVLYPGSYSVPDGKGGQRRVSFSERDVDHLTRRMQAMLAAGLSIPLAAEHQDRAKPLTPEERKAAWVKQLTLGWAEAASKPEGYLSTQVEVPEVEDQKAIRRVRFVSPEIVHDFVDGTGRLWPGPSITHLAVTPRPVNANQRPFEPVQMSVIRLSLDHYQLSQGATVADEKPEETPEETPEEKPVETPEETPEEQPDERQQYLDEVLAVLREDGYGLPGDTDAKNLVERLHTAALTKKAMIEQALSDEDEETPPGSREAAAQPEPESGPVMMSLTVMGRKIKVPVKRKPKPAARPVQLSLTDSDPKTKRLLKLERNGILGRIKRLLESGRISKAIADKLNKQATTVQLSLDAAGELAGNAVLAKLEAYEELHEGASWANTGTLPDGVQAVPAPQGSWERGPQSAEAVSSTVNDFFSMLPGAPSAAAQTK